MPTPCSDFEISIKEEKKFLKQYFRKCIISLENTNYSVSE
jgi:hypothetical protein